MKQTLRVNRPASFGSIIASLPAVGTQAFAESFVRGELSTYGMGSQLAEWLIAQETGEKTAASIGKACQKHLASFGLMPANPGYQSIRKDAKQGGMILAAARCCQKVEQATSRALKPALVVVADSTPDAVTLANMTDEERAKVMLATPSATPSNVEVQHLDSKGKQRTALGDLKGLTAKGELARIFAEMQQACINEDLSKLSDLILEGQKILAIAK